MPVLAYKKANAAGILPAVLFYYELKRLTIQGYFAGLQYVDFIRRRTGLSPASIYRGFALLEQAGIARRETGKIWLLSYDLLFERLGIQVGSQDGSRLLKIESRGNVEDKWQAAEIEHNLNQQQVALENKYVKLQTGRRDTDKTPSRKLKKRLLAQFDRVGALNNFLGDILNSPKGQLNYDVSLTCFAVAELFGFTSAAMGHKIEHRLKERGLLQIENRFLVIQHRMGREEFLSLRLQDSSFFLRGGRLSKQLPNLLTVC